MATHNVTFADPSSAEVLGSMHPISAPSPVQTVMQVFVVRVRNALHGPAAPTRIVSTVGTASIMQAENVRFLAHLGLQWSAQMIWVVGLTLLVTLRRRAHMKVDLSP
jgi:hypothetical protein